MLDYINVNQCKNLSSYSGSPLWTHVGKTWIAAHIMQYQWYESWEDGMPISTRDCIYIPLDILLNRRYFEFHVRIFFTYHDPILQVAITDFSQTDSLIQNSKYTCVMVFRIVILHHSKQIELIFVIVLLLSQVMRLWCLRLLILILINYMKLTTSSNQQQYSIFHEFRNKCNLLTMLYLDIDHACCISIGYCNDTWID